MATFKVYFGNYWRVNEGKVMAGTAARVEAVRRFNRFYTRVIGLLQEGLLDSRFALTEARVVWELAARGETTAGVLARELGLNAGYLSRILSKLQRQRLIRRRAGETDRRQQILSLTPMGRRAFARLDAASRAQIEALLDPLNEAAQSRLAGAMGTIENVLGAASSVGGEACNLRPHRAGDMGWVIHRHGVLYAREYGWDETFEALVAEIAAGFLRHFDPQSERCWIAERNGDNVGSVFLMKHPERAGVAQLRLLLVEPSARGLGLGRQLVEECTRFAADVGYHTITLWTNSVLHAARRIYEQEGYRLVHEEPHYSFGHDLVGQIWELSVTAASGP